MDRAIVEVINTVAIIIISALVIYSLFDIYTIAKSTDEVLYSKFIYTKIKNIIYELVSKDQDPDKMINITLILDQFIYIRAIDDYKLLLKIGNTQMYLDSPLKVKGEVFSNSLMFSLFNHTISISKLSPLYIPPIIVR
ncbi:MAG: hypothetical protein RQ952_06795 [Thermoproteota archaeon]|jgi:hypothetical protein|nr:hypothetical protein [Thermoproteota archaeon]